MRLLFVCTGNTCRSPMLAALTGHALASAGVRAEIASAGTGATAGEPASHGAVAAMARRGLDLTAHRSRSVADLDLSAFDRIYAVSPRHAAYVRAQGVPPGRISVVAAERGGVPDPWGGDDAEYEACARLLAGEAARIAGEVASA